MAEGRTATEMEVGRAAQQMLCGTEWWVGRDKISFICRPWENPAGILRQKGRRQPSRHGGW